MSSRKHVNLEYMSKGSYGRVSRVNLSELEGSRDLIIVNNKLVSHDKYYDGTVVIKQNFRNEDSSYAVSLREFDSLMRCNGHPYIVPLLAVLLEKEIFDDTPLSPTRKLKCDSIHYVMPKAKDDLSSIIDYGINGEKLAYKPMKSLMLEIALGLRYLHAQGIIHRDLKPGNILIFTRDNDDRIRVKICDFGFSKPYSRQDLRQSRSGTRGCNSPVICTAGYRPPENVNRERDYDFSTDIWVLGSIFYEMIEGNQICRVTKDDNDKITRIFTKIYDEYDTLNFEELFRSFFNNPAHLKDFNESPGTFEEFCDLLDKMMRYKKEDRITIEEVITHPFFADYQILTDYCEKIFPTDVLKTHNIEIVEYDARKTIVFDFFYAELFVKCKYRSYFDYRVLFLAIDLFERYLKMRQDNEEAFCRGKYDSDKEIYNSLYMIFYMAIKYYRSTDSPSLLDILPEEFTTVHEERYNPREQKNLDSMERKERRFIRYLVDMYIKRREANSANRYCIYRPTIYEYTDVEYTDRILSEKEIGGMIGCYFDLAPGTYDLANIYEHFWT